MRWRDGRGVERTFGVECTPETRRPPCGLFLSPSATASVEATLASLPFFFPPFPLFLLFVKGIYAT